MMKKVHTLVIASLFVSGAAMADHNSIWGEGWANMPNDIHDTRIDTLGDNDAFQDAIGAGSSASDDLLSSLDSISGDAMGAGSSTSDDLLSTLDSVSGDAMGGGAATMRGVGRVR